MKFVIVLLILFFFEIANGFTCNEVKGLYNINSCCSGTAPNQEICSEIASGDRLANMFKLQLTHNGAHVQLEGVQNDNDGKTEGDDGFIHADSLQWTELTNLVFSDSDISDETIQKQYNNLRQNLATLTAIEPVDLVKLMLGQQ